jgi:hypothetical protein
MMKNRNEVFEIWYSRRFGELLGEQDSHTREFVREIWNQALSRAVDHFEFENFEPLESGQIIDRLERLKAIR